jgi:hypothetical protein
MLHHQEVGTFAPTFRTIDDAEEFSNAMRLLTVDVAISEPVPLINTTGIIMPAEEQAERLTDCDWDQEYKKHLRSANRHV